MLEKRRRADDSHNAGSVKRARTGSQQCLDLLSDELLLKILSNLSAEELLRTERVCHRFLRLATDFELWKACYFERWVGPRLRRRDHNPELRAASISRVQYADYLESSQLAQGEKGKDYKWRYKLMSNWTRGRCVLREHEIGKFCTQPVRAKVHQGLIFTTDATEGLRVWNSKETQITAQTDLLIEALPVSLDVDSVHGKTFVLVGYTNGRWSLHTFFANNFSLNPLVYSSRVESEIIEISLAMPFVASLAADQTLNLYEVCEENESPHCEKIIAIASLRSEKQYSPCSLGIRRSIDGAVATIAYATYILNSGWCIGLQETRMASGHGIVSNRIACAVDAQVRRKKNSCRESWRTSSRSTATQVFALHPSLMRSPTSLSYSHPYLLASLPDNTLMVYLVRSDPDVLEIDNGRRLWGHTSSISGADISNRGKAVSVSKYSSEIRVWELEKALLSYRESSFSTRIAPTHELDELTSAIGRRGNGLGLAVQEMKQETLQSRSWVGFDEEQVAVLGDRDASHILALYDFT